MTSYHLYINNKFLTCILSVFQLTKAYVGETSWYIQPSCYVSAQEINLFAISHVAISLYSIRAYHARGCHWLLTCQPTVMGRYTGEAERGERVQSLTLPPRAESLSLSFLLLARGRRSSERTLRAAVNWTLPGGDHATPLYLLSISRPPTASGWTSMS